MARKAERDHTCLKISVAQVSLPFPRHGYRGSLSSSSGAQGSVKERLMLVWLLQQANQQALGWLCIG